ncbi:MAG: HD domain-containing protein [Planctomycetota bacterium]|nr:HD domain-containing protein [Planctomycetota bacterium]
MKVRVLIKKGKMKGKTIDVSEGDNLVFGRDSTCDVQLLDHGLSRSHLLLANDGESVQASDLGSSNGTFVNGRRVQSIYLAPGDVINVGEAEMEILADKKMDTTKVLIDLKADVFQDEAAKQQIKKRFEGSEEELVKKLEATREEKDAKVAHQNLATIYKITNLLHQKEDLKELFDVMMTTILEVFAADRGFLVMYNKDRGVYEPVVTRTGPTCMPGYKIALSSTILSESIKNGLSVLTQDATQDARFQSGESVFLNRIRGAMCVPVESRQGILGAIYLDNVSQTGSFTESDLELLTVIGKQAGVAIRRATLVDELESLFLGTVQSLTAAIDAKDPYTRGHSERVSLYGEIMARELGLDKEVVRHLKLSCLFHDIGKIGVPEYILNKPDKLTAEEYEQIKEHPVIGANILATIKDIEPMVHGVLYHHEWFNGNGYPEGIAEEAIPLLPRIISLVDAFDAMTSDRAYRKSLQLQIVLDQFTKGSGSQFDPKLAKLAIELIEQEKLVPIVGDPTKYEHEAEPASSN